MVRTRQKGKKVGLVSMRKNCNHDLYNTPHVKDYDVVWIEDFLDELIRPLKNVDKKAQAVHERGIISTLTFTEVILSFISNSPNGYVSSRDIGRYLKGLEVSDGTKLLDDMKLGEGGLTRFLMRMSHVFDVSEVEREGPKNFNYWISKNERYSGQQGLTEEDTSMLSPIEKHFLQDFRSGKIGEVNDKSFEFTRERYFGAEKEKKEEPEPPQNENQDEENFSSWTVVKLKERCRERDLPVSGKKAVLVERILSDIEKEKVRNASNGYDCVDPNATKHVQDLVKYYLTEKGGFASVNTLAEFLISNNNPSQAENALNEVLKKFGDIPTFLDNADFVRLSEDGQVVMLEKRRDNFADASSSIYLENMIKEYLKASGGVSELRNIGRYLQANKCMNFSEESPVKTALQQLKVEFGSLKNFLMNKDSFKLNLNGKIKVMLQNEYGKRTDSNTYLDNMLKEYLKASGGVAAARDIGRYLQTSRSEISGFNALQQLKKEYGSLNMFLRNRNDMFRILPSDQYQLQGVNNFLVEIVEQ